MIRPPTPATLRKYGLSLVDWMEILNRQGGVCYICGKEPSTGRLCIDHEHVKGWAKMPDDERKKYTRGLLCWFCNTTILSRGTNLTKLRQAVLYLEEYERRKAWTNGQTVNSLK